MTASFSIFSEIVKIYFIYMNLSGLAAFLLGVATNLFGLVVCGDENFIQNFLESCVSSLSIRKHIFVGAKLFCFL